MYDEVYIGETINWTNYISLNEDVGLEKDISVEVFSYLIL